MTYVVTLCIALLTAPVTQTCKEIQVPVESCSAMGIAAQAQWVMANPDYRIVKWLGCKAGERAA